MNMLWFKTRQIRYHRKGFFFYIFSLVWIVYMQSCRSSVIKELHAWNYYLSSRMNHLCALSITSGLQDIVSESENMNSFTVFQIRVNSPACILGMPVWGIWHISMAASAQASLYLQRYLSKGEHADEIFTLMWTTTVEGLGTYLLFYQALCEGC